MKRLISLLMVFCMLSGFITVRAEETLSANVVLKFNNPGNIYFTGDTESLTASYFNNSASSMDLDISFLATGRKFGNTWSYETSASLGSNKSTKETIKIDFAEDIGVYDIYDLVVTMTDGTSTKTVATEFSYAKRGVKNDRFGVNTHFAMIDYNSYLDKSMSILKNSGVSMVRDNLPAWSTFETTKGEYVIPAIYQNIIDKLVENDIEILNVLAYGNTLYTGSDGDVKIPVTSDEITAFKNYVEKYVLATKDKIKYFEIWNEPNVATFNAGSDDGKGYGNLVKEVYPVIKKSNPESYVLGYSSSGLNNNINKTAATGANNYMDAASFHPYSEYTSEGWNQLWATGNHIPEDRTTSYFSEFRTRSQKENIWVTEQGWSDGDNKNSEALQAAYLVRAYTLSMADGNVEKYFWYEFIRSAIYGDTHEGKFGMLNGRLQSVPLGARPVFMSMTNMNSKLANTEFVTYNTSNDVYKCDFTKSNGDDLSVIWLKTKNEAATKTASYDFGCKRLLKTDIYGNEEVLTSENGVYTIKAGCDPQYFEPIANEMEKFAYDYDTKTGICTVEGYIDAKEDNIPVNMMLYRPNKGYADLTTENEMQTLSYFDQCTSKIEGVYEFEFSPQDGEGVYLLKLASEDGETFETYIDLRSKLVCTAEIQGKSINDVKTGEKFTVDVNVIGENEVYKEYNVYVALYSGNRLVKVFGTNGEVMNNVRSKTTSIELVSEYEFDEIRAFAWEPDMTPLGNSVTIAKTK